MPDPDAGVQVGRGAVNWTELMLPGRVRRSLRSWRRLRFRYVGALINHLLRFQRSPPGRLLPLRRYADLVAFLDEGNAAVHVLRSKQHVLSGRCGNEFLRYSHHRKGIRSIEREYANWRLMQEFGLSHIAPKEMRLVRLTKGVVLISEALQEIHSCEVCSALEEIVISLVRQCRHAVPGLPVTIEAGLDLMHHLTGKELEREEEVKACFEQPLRVGFFHGDLHDRNVMRGRYGQSGLIDLKSCGLDRIVALDLLRFVVGRYPDDLTTNPAWKIVRIHATGWDLPMIQPFLQYIDLPRRLWGQIYFLHLLGSVAQKPSRRFAKARDPKQNPLLSGLLTQLIAVG
jgi:hypothetical protein